MAYLSSDVCDLSGSLGVTWLTYHLMYVGITRSNMDYLSSDVCDLSGSLGVTWLTYHLMYVTCQDHSE